MSRDFRFSGQMGDNECIDVLVSDILTLASEKSTDFAGVGGGVRNGLGWDFSAGENAPSGYSG